MILRLSYYFVAVWACGFVGLTLESKCLSNFYDTIWKGAEYMTKARARQRAKAKALDKAKRRIAGTDQSEQRIRPAKFDPGTLPTKGRGMNANTNNLAGPRRGGARSK